MLAPRASIFSRRYAVGFASKYKAYGTSVVYEARLAAFTAQRQARQNLKLLATQVEQFLTVQSQIGQCVVLSKRRGLQISVLASEADSDSDGKNVDKQDVINLLEDQGFSFPLPTCDIEFVDYVDKLPEREHQRVTFLDLLRILFAEADVEDNGSITFQEFENFLTRHNIAFSSSFDPEYYSKVFHEHAVSYGERLIFSEFRNLLMSQGLLTLQDNTGDGAAEEFGVHPRVLEILSDHFFTKADIDSTGYISEDDVIKMFSVYRLGDEEDAKEAFQQFDCDEDGFLRRDDFEQFLRTIGIVGTPIIEGEEGICTMM